MSNPSIWIAVADVVPQKGNYLLGNASGAYVGVAGLSESEMAFKDLVASSLEAMGFHLFHLEDVEAIVSSAQELSIDAELLAKAQALTVEAPFAFGSFHSYHADGPT